MIREDVYNRFLRSQKDCCRIQGAAGMPDADSSENTGGVRISSV
jgi:hypothetical protein